jgi:hypothetical protein
MVARYNKMLADQRVETHAMAVKQLDEYHKVRRDRVLRE